MIDPMTYDICAESEQEARKMAASESWGEGDEAWLSDYYSTCTRLTPDGEPGIIMADYYED